MIQAQHVRQGHLSSETLTQYFNFILGKTFKGYGIYMDYT